MMSVDEIKNSLKFVTENGAKTMYIKDYGIKEGNSANFVVLDEKNVFDAVRNTASTILSEETVRLLWKNNLKKCLQPTTFRSVYEDHASYDQS